MAWKSRLRALFGNHIPRGPKREPGTALVTGANRGIGLEVVHQLADIRWQVFLTARDAEAGATVASKVGDRVTFVPMDVTCEKSIVSAVETVSSLTQELDLLVNNAGILFRKQDQSVVNVDVDILRQCWETNCLGPLLVIRAFLPLLRKSQSAQIINVSSDMGRLYPDHHETPAYGISKTGLNAVTKWFATACKSHNIQVNAICPGWVQSDMGGSQAPRSLENGAAQIVKLATDLPRDITGKFIEDGRILRW